MCSFVDCSVRINEARYTDKRRQHLRRVHPDEDIPKPVRKKNNERQNSRRQEERARSRDSKEEKKKRAHALRVAQQDYWCDKPLDMDDDELVKECP